MDKSKSCKIYRKNIIKYLRQPIWIILLLICLYKSQDIPTIMLYNGVIT
jgi:hypothetical protein